MMKKLLSLLLLIIILLSLFMFYINNNANLIISHLLKAGDIKWGELVYRVNLFGIIPIGKATLQIANVEKYNNQEVYHLSAIAGPLKLYSKFLKGYAIMDSYIDKKTNDPILFEQKIAIPGKPIENRVVSYDQKNLIMTMDGIRRQILAHTQDPLSAVFNISRMDFDKIKEFEMNINTNQKNYILEAVARQKDLMIDNKIIKIILIKSEIRRRDKNPYHKSNIGMVLLKEQENIPILIRVFASGILMNANLVDIK